MVSARGAAPWCPSCEWNLDLFEPRRRPPEFGWKWADRLTHRVAYRLTERQFAALAGAPIARRSATLPRIALMAVALVLLAVLLGCTALGAWLVLHDFPGLALVPGVLLLLIAVAARPRLGKLADDVTVLDRGRAPALFDLVDRVAAAVGTRAPDVIGVDPAFNAYTTMVGLRRRRVLCLGLPLFVTLRPQERVALVGHEMGHFVNGDVRRGPLTGVAISTLGLLSYLTSPGGSAVRHTGIVAMLTTSVQWVLSRLLRGVHLLLVWIGQRDGQRAEYLADELSARAAGTPAAVGFLGMFVVSDSIDTVIRREARANGGGDAWRAAADVARANLADAMPRLGQLTRRDEVSLFASHPPDGLRTSMLEQGPAYPPAVVLTESQSAAIDDELAALVERVRRDLARA